MQNILSIATNIISNDMSVFGANVRRTNSEIMSFVTSKTPGGITTKIECSTMTTTGQPIPNSRYAMSIENSTCFDTLPVP